MCQSIWKDKCAQFEAVDPKLLSLNQNLDHCFTAGAQWNAEEKAQRIFPTFRGSRGSRVRSNWFLQHQERSDPSYIVIKVVWMLSVQNLAQSVRFWVSLQNWHVVHIWKDSQCLANFPMATALSGTDLWLCFEIAMRLHFISLLLTWKQVKPRVLPEFYSEVLRGLSLKEMQSRRCISFCENFYSFGIMIYHNY